MKTDRYYTALMILLVLVLAIALNVTAASSTLNDASMVPTNPPTSESAMNMEFEFEEEAYIDDIPFNTKCISAMCAYNKAVAESYELEDEMYIEDIPFDTEEVAGTANYEMANEEEFLFEEEAYIDDIPFETYTITQVYLQSHIASAK